MNKIIVMAVLLLVLTLFTGCTEIKKVVDPCASAFEDCKYGCGTGILSSVCKEVCTYDYNKCKQNNG
ncbi:hypothetical protein J4404_02800 [Candidatus Woesearchaeota archaeon]|nr:hypothetical protein [Candidatus Woesearchaeota archaeon]